MPQKIKAEPIFRLKRIGGYVSVASARVDGRNSSRLCVKVDGLEVVCGTTPRDGRYSNEQLEELINGGSVPHSSKLYSALEALADRAEEALAGGVQ